MRKLVVSCLLLTSIALAVPYSSVQAADSLMPPVGGWSWCSDTVKNGCIESVTTISPEKVETTYTSASQLPVGLRVSAQCSPNGPINTCDTNRYLTRSDGQCAETPTWGGRYTTPSIEFDIDWPGKSGWQVRLRLSTGDFRTAFSIGYGTTTTSTTSDGDGTYTYINTVLIGKSYSASMPQSIIGLMGTPQYMPAYTEWLKTSVATSEKDAAHVQVWPRDHLLRQPSNTISNSGPSLNPTTTTIPATPTGCQYYPFDGAFAEANATSFSWSYSSGSMSPGAPNVLKFIAQAPHYLPQVEGQPLQVMPARVQVFLPTSYFSALGYSSLTEFNQSSYSVTTEDGQTTTPTVTIRDNGILINLGLQHYSAPNPTVTIVSKGSALNVTTDLATTTPMPAVTNATLAPKIFSPLTSLARKKSAPLSSFISYSGPGAKSWRATGGCTIVKSALRAPSTKSKCKLTLTVRNSKKKVLATRTQVIRVL